MNRYQQIDLGIPRPTPEASVPPANVGETGWDILLALHSSHRHQMSVKRLGSLLSVAPHVMHYWLGWLEDRWLVKAAKDEVNGEVGTILTRHGLEVLDRYLSALNALHAER
ncbi:hypothetical protein IAG41_10185 [Sphingomonas sp. JC676]|uniref:hypothetical protein n=1 Tax=Sphingomonas sp. JC676 TaxID=2768065 RepID=UPI00165867C2|nr:hypothetical protein [Sphingomonas sp. JC676]MBC9032759.1 hypothetical protein [Sphingomonas sp. JC676]